jgi:hypothetical protein
MTEALAIDDLKEVIQDHILWIGALLLIIRFM